MRRFNLAWVVGLAIAGITGTGGCCSCCGGACGESCYVRQPCSGEQSCSNQSCGCNRGRSCNEPCSCCRPCLFPNLFPWLRCERCKGAGEQYGECSTCGCGECYEGDWRSQPPRCEPCDHCGNWIGPGEPLPPYQMPARVGTGYPPANGPLYHNPPTNDSLNAIPSSPPSSPPPTTTTPHTTQRPGPNWSNY